MQIPSGHGLGAIYQLTKLDGRIWLHRGIASMLQSIKNSNDIYINSDDPKKSKGTLSESGLDKLAISQRPIQHGDAKLPQGNQNKPLSVIKTAMESLSKCQSTGLLEGVKFPVDSELKSPALVKAAMERLAKSPNNGQSEGVKIPVGNELKSPALVKAAMERLAKSQNNGQSEGVKIPVGNELKSPARVKAAIEKLESSQNTYLQKVVKTYPANQRKLSPRVKAAVDKLENCQNTSRLDGVKTPIYALEDKYRSFLDRMCNIIIHIEKDVEEMKVDILSVNKNMTEAKQLKFKDDLTKYYRNLINTGKLEILKQLEEFKNYINCVNYNEIHKHSVEAMLATAIKLSLRLISKAEKLTDWSKKTDGTGCYPKLLSI